MIIDPTNSITRHQELIREAELRRRGRGYTAPRRSWSAARLTAWVTRIVRTGDRIGADETVASPAPR